MAKSVKIYLQIDLPSSSQASQAPTSYSPLPYGTKAFFLTLERLPLEDLRNPAAQELDTALDVLFKIVGLSPG